MDIISTGRCPFFVLGQYIDMDENYTTELHKYSVNDTLHSSVYKKS